MFILAKKILWHTSLWLGRLAYGKKYIQGRHFEFGNDGWKWVYKGIWFQKILGFNRRVPWPCAPFLHIGKPDRIHFHPDELNNFQSPGLYLQTNGGDIYIGKDAMIGPNVGIITANHDPVNVRGHVSGADVVIGEACWIGMNTVVMPGVVLGRGTVVGAGSVVTRSFPEGRCLIAGAPARLIKTYPSHSTALEEGSQES